MLATLTKIPLREIDDDIVDITSIPPRAHYDLIAPAYDVLVGSAIWHRVLWGTTPGAFRAFASAAYRSQAEGPHVEVGCGSLLFTSHLYGDDHGRAAVLIDQSIRMLRLARRRLRKRYGSVPRHVVLVRGDARELAVTGGWASTVLSMHVLHVIRERAALLRTIAALARPSKSTIALTSIFLSGRRTDFVIPMFAALGELAPGLTRAQIEVLLVEHLGRRPSVEVEGSMAYITA
jgi:SAM-dependent methyltransferase